MQENEAGFATRLSFWVILFLLYINDLTENVQGAKPVLFTDANICKLLDKKNLTSNIK
jgi:hypothetical protein